MYSREIDRFSSLEKLAFDKAIAAPIRQSAGIWFVATALLTLKITGLAQHDLCSRQLLAIVRCRVPHAHSEAPAHFKKMLKEALSRYLQPM